MAVLSATRKGPIFKGLKARQSATADDKESTVVYGIAVYEVALTGTSPADEWIVTDFDTVVAVVGTNVIGTAGVIDAPAFKLNLAGTGGAATPGALGLESVTAQTIQVTVLGEL